MDTEIDTQRENVKTHMKNAMLIQRIRVIVLQAKKKKKIANKLPEARKTHRKIPLQFSQKYWSANTLFWHSSLHNCDTVSFSCFLSPSLWCFVNSIPGNLFPWPLRLHFCFRDSDAHFRTNSNLMTLSGFKCCS